MGVALLGNLLDPRCIVLDVQATGWESAIAEVADRFRLLSQMRDFSAYFAGLLERERKDTTCIGNGVAMPHARTGQTDEILLAVGRMPRGLTSGNSREPVNLMFVLATPATRPQDHLMVLGALCRVLKDAPVREALMAAATPQAFIALIRETEQKNLRR